MSTRRRVLSILAGVAALPIVGARASTDVYNWRGIALGAEARIILDHPQAEQLITGAVAEIRRLESIFSLYDEKSELSRLNQDGTIHAPTFELIELFSICSNIYTRTHGAFDPTVQSLWALYARSFANGQAPVLAQIEEAQKLTGWDKVLYSPTQIHFSHPGMQITLNGIAQGFIADKITQYFRAAGVNNVLVNTGEIAAMGTNPQGDIWQVGFNNSNTQKYTLDNAAIATSAPLGTTFDVGGNVGHILDPRNGLPGGLWAEISVISNSASEADGLSTAFSLMNKSQIDSAIGNSEVILRT